MSDITIRLRTWLKAVDAVPAIDLMDEAANEIARLRGDAEVARLRMEAAQGEIDRLRLELSVQKACTVAGREEIARLRAKTLFPKERRTLAWAATYVERSTFKNQAATLRSLLKRLL